MTVPPTVHGTRSHGSGLLLGMSYADPDVRPLLDLEGLKAWEAGRTSGYGQLTRRVGDRVLRREGRHDATDYRP